MRLVDPSPRLPTTRGERLTVAMLGLILGGLVVIDLLDDFHVDKLSLPFVALFWLPSMLLHEIGHAVAARVVRWRIATFAVGLGRDVYRFRLGRASVVLRALPMGGYVVPDPTRSRGSRAARAWVYLGGPLANLALFWSLSGTLARGVLAANAGPALVAAQSLAVTSALVALVSLAPYVTRQCPSDGLGIIESLLGSPERLRSVSLWPFVNEATRLLLLERSDLANQVLQQGLQRYPGDPTLEGLVAVREACDGDRDSAFARLEAAGPPGRHGADVEAWLLADAAWSVLVSEASGELLNDARTALMRALELRPDWCHARLLLGRLHVELDRPESAYEELLRAYRNPGTLEEEAQCVAFLALACSALASKSGSAQMAQYGHRYARAIHPHALGPKLAERVRAHVPFPS